jgi:lysophospholipid acyltransferase (LPLAT)-like uncharacterized protein
MKKNLYKHVLPYILFVILYLIGKTLRVQIINRDVESQLEKQGKAIIYTFWHGRMLYFPYLYRFSNKSTILTSPSEDGEIVARTAKIFGFSSIRGSSFKKGGSALLKMTRSIKKGKAVTVVGDGSRGPLYKVQEGIINLAYLTGAPILPVVYGVKNKIQLNTWDQFIIPLPFSKIKVMYGDPVYVDKKTEEKKSKSKLEELEIKLKEITQAVDSWD